MSKKALLKSIQHWQELHDTVDFSDAGYCLGPRNCALCLEYRFGRELFYCLDCPIYKHTGCNRNCEGTNYRAASILLKIITSKNLNPTKKQLDDWKKETKKMLDLLNEILQDYAHD